MRRSLAVAASAAGAFALTVAPAFADLRSVSVGSFYFEDSTTGDGKVVANVGDQLTFVFSGNVQHSAKVDGLFDSGVKKPGTTFTTGALMKAGTYTLYCTVHGVSRHSTSLVVTGTTTAPSPTPSPTGGGGTTGGSTSGGSTTTTGGSTTGGSSTGGSTTGGSTTGGSTTGGSTTGGSTTGGSATGGSTTGATTTSPKPTATTTASSTSGAASRATSSPTPSFAPVGDGVAELAQAPTAAGSLSEAIGRAPAAQGSWTRSFRQALLGLIPMIAAAAWALRRRPDRA